MTFNLKYVEEASVKNLEIIEDLDEGKYLYKRLGCNHTFISNPNSVRHNTMSYCKPCAQGEFISHAKIRGLKLIEFGAGSDPDTYEVEKCEHIVQLYRNNLFKASSEVKCPICYEESLLKSLFDKNVEEICDKKRKRSKFRYKDCGHEFEHARWSVEKIPKCQQCRELNFQKDLSEKGVSLIRYVTAAQAMFKFNKCGHERLLYISAVKRGNFVCHECNVTAWTLPSLFYIFEFETDEGFKFIKFGYGKDTKNRIREYRLKNVKLNNVLFEMPAETGYSAMLVEKSIHKDYKEMLLDSLTMKKYFTKGGYSECYNMDMFETIRDEVIRRYNNLSDEEKEYVRQT